MIPGLTPWRLQRIKTLLRTSSKDWLTLECLGIAYLGSLTFAVPIALFTSEGNPSDYLAAVLVVSVIMEMVLFATLFTSVSIDSMEEAYQDLSFGWLHKLLRRWL